ncbi:MAG: alternative ribosome rescue aminoacyl-tRNA hydrolase ArfB [Acidimicrobiales bacterium]
MERDLVVTPTWRIPADELEWKFCASGGPGGQHANTANTRAEVRFDIAEAASLSPENRALLLDRLGPAVRVTADDHRSQNRNRRLAGERLVERLADGLRVDPPRRRTRVPAGATRARVQAKARRGALKRLRGRPDPDL